MVGGSLRGAVGRGQGGGEVPTSSSEVSSRVGVDVAWSLSRPRTPGPAARAPSPHVHCAL